METALPYFTFCGAIVLHSITGIFFGSAVVRFLIIAGLFGALLASHFMSRTGFSPDLFAAIFAYGFLCELYIFLFTFCLASVSANLIMCIAGGMRDISALSERYDSADMVHLRLERLKASAFLRQNGDRLTLTPRAHFLVTLYRMLRVFFRH